MKKFLWAVIYIFEFITVFGFSAYTKFLSVTGLNGNAGDYTLQGDRVAEAFSLDQTEKEIIDIKYITKNGKVEKRPVAIYRPKDARGDIPLIYIPHYAADEGSSDFQSYLKNGWACASPYDFKNEYNGELVTDDLIFNNAALYTLRNTDGIDKQRIVIAGGSAGGYTALMLGGLQMGSAAVIANSPVTNVYFNFHIYFPACDKLNRSGLFDFPIPVQGMVSKMFRPVNDNFQSDDDPLWEAVSPVSMAKDFSSPVVVNHFTADILVPVDQISGKYTYHKNDGTLPESFHTRMPDDGTGILSMTLEGQAIPEETSISRYKLQDHHLDMDMPYSDKLLTINIYDDGPVSAKGGHTSPATTGAADSIPFLKNIFAKTLKETERLVPEKIILMLDRYQGSSKQLPAHEGIDDTAYGSLSICQEEITEEFSTYTDNHSLEELDAGIKKAINGLSESEAARESYKETWSRIKSRLDQK